MNLFYLREYLSYYDDIDKKGSDGDFIDKLWGKVIQGPSINNGINVSRDKCMVTIARHRADSGDFYTDGDSLPSDALFALTQDEILSIGNDRGGYFITHDIYEEWALRKIIDREWRRSPDCRSFFENVGDSLPIRKALRMWLFDKLQENELGLPDILSEAFSESELPQFWLDEILVACMLSDKAHQFFAFFEDRIIADAYSLFKRILFLYNTPRFSDSHKDGGMRKNRYLCGKEENQNGKTIEIHSSFQGQGRRGSPQGNRTAGDAGQKVWRGTLENHGMEERAA